MSAGKFCPLTTIAFSVALARPKEKGQIELDPQCQAHLCALWDDAAEACSIVNASRMLTRLASDPPEPRP